MRSHLILLALLFFLPSIFLSCERKKEFREEVELRKKAAHCFNGQYNEKELAVDCGKECGNCENTEPGCDPIDNEALFFDGTTKSESTYQINNISCELGPNDDPQAIATFNNDTLKIFPDTVDTRLSLTTNCDYTTGELNSDWKVYYGGQPVCESSIFIGVEDERRYIALCGGTIENYGFNVTDDTLRYAKMICSP